MLLPTSQGKVGIFGRSKGFASISLSYQLPPFYFYVILSQYCVCKVIFNCYFSVFVFRALVVIEGEATQNMSNGSRESADPVTSPASVPAHHGASPIKFVGENSLNQLTTVTPPPKEHKAGGVNNGGSFSTKSNPIVFATPSKPAASPNSTPPTGTKSIMKEPKREGNGEGKETRLTMGNLMGVVDRDRANSFLKQYETNIAHVPPAHNFT
jgi:hypothetical protein